jgi:hypothetical protein
MTDNLPELAPNGALNAVREAKTPDQRQKAANLAGQYTTSPYFTEPVPAFFLDLPHGDDNEEISDRIALQTMTAEDPDAVLSEGGTTPLKDLVNRSIVVWDIRAMRGGMDKGWQAYLIVDYTEGDSDYHRVGNTGAKQVVARLARAYCDGQLPLKGRVCEISRAGGSGNKPLAFVAEEDF